MTLLDETIVSVEGYADWRQMPIRRTVELAGVIVEWFHGAGEVGAQEEKTPVAWAISSDKRGNRRQRRAR